ncbi:MAG TPA: hypothetical protein VK083_01140 [Nocardia sp.]|nr:hypothetical protein [Nocardia sp.]HLS75378.1 hypothetical protein [Nocardia sp.]
MSDVFAAISGELSAHADQVAGFADRLATITEAAAAATESEDLTFAFGVLGNPIGWLLKSQIQEPAVGQIGQIAEGTKILGERVALCAQIFAALDEAAAKAMTEQAEGLEQP